MTKELDCNFQNNDFCQWISDKNRATVEWTFNKLKYNGMTDTQTIIQGLGAPLFKTGPQNGDRFGSRCLYFKLIILSFKFLKISELSKI